jgi:hypothetical protein
LCAFYNFSFIEDTSTLINIAHDVKAMYQLGKTKLSDFKYKKMYLIEIHQSLVKIGRNLIQSLEALEILFDSLFFDDMIAYFVLISGRKKNIDKSIVRKSDFIKTVFDKKKSIPINHIKMIVYDIVENSIFIIKSLLQADLKVSQIFKNKVFIKNKIAKSVWYKRY